MLHSLLCLFGFHAWTFYQDSNGWQWRRCDRCYAEKLCKKAVQE